MKLDQRTVNLFAVLGLGLLVAIWARCSEADVVALQGGMAIGQPGELRHQQVGDLVYWFGNDGKVFLTVKDCPNALFWKKGDVWSYRCG